jgi:hypothetical protein
MDRPRQDQQIGAPWIAAMVLLAILLVLGVLLYVRMSAPLHEPGNRTTGVAPRRTCCGCADSESRLLIESGECPVLRRV